MSRIYQYTLSETVWTVDISDFALTDPPSVICQDDLPRMFTSYEQDPRRCVSQDTELVPVSSTTSTFVTDITPLSASLKSGDTIIPFDGAFPDPISGATYDGEEFRFVLDYTARDLAFNDNGTKMFVAGNQTDAVFQFTLTTPFDVTTSTYDQVYYRSTTTANIVGVAFNNDGTRMFTLSGGSIYQVTLGTPYDLAGAVVYTEGESISVGLIDESQYAIEFNNDGSKLYFIGFDSIYEIPLSTPFDITTANLTGTPSYAPGLSNGQMEAIAFNDTGTKMYILDRSATTINQFSLSAAFDVTTASNDGVTYSTTNEDTIPRAVALSNDGSSLALIGGQFGSVFQYSLSTPYDISTVTFVGTGQDLVGKVNGVNYDDGEISNPQSGTWSADGTKFFLMNTTSAAILQYPVATPFDISTMDNRPEAQFDVSDTDSYPYDVEFSNDGTKLFLFGSDFSYIYQFSLSTAFDLTNASASYDNVFVDLSAQRGFGDKVTFSSTGTKLFYLANNEIYQYSLSTPFDLSTVSYDSVTTNFDSFLFGAPVYDFHFNADGTRLYLLIVDGLSGLLQFSLETGFDISTASPDDAVYPFPSEIFSVTYVAWSADGSKFYVGFDGNGIGLRQFSVNDTINGIDFVEGPGIALTEDAAITITDTSVAGYSYDSVSFDVSSQEITPLSIAFNTDGSKMYIVGSDSDSIYQYSLSTEFDLSTASYDNVSFSIGAQETQPYSLRFDNNGLKAFSVGVDSDTVYQYALAVPFDISTTTYNDINFVVTEDTTPYGIAFNDDGTKLYIAGGNTSTVYQYTLSTAFDVSSAAYDSVSFDFFASQADVPLSIDFNDDGSKMYILGLNSELLYQYSLSTGFDISSAAYDGVSFNSQTEETAPRDFVFNNDQTKLFIVGIDNDTVYQYSLVQDAYTLTFPTLSYAPSKIIVPDRSTEHTAVESDQWVENYIQTNYSRVDGVGRAIQYKFVADTDQEVIEARYDLTKTRPGIRDTEGLIPPEDLLP